MTLVPLEYRSRNFWKQAKFIKLLNYCANKITTMTAIASSLTETSLAKYYLAEVNITS